MDNDYKLNRIEMQLCDIQGRLLTFPQIEESIA